MDPRASCLFCKIVRGDLRADVLHRDDAVVAFRDVNPQAPSHVLVVPVRHVSTLAELGDADGDLLGRMMLRAIALARQEGLAHGGYRLVWNCGPDGGQSVFHIHLHLLGGREMSWPPG
jgi:histidine triad (HIT) family protein